MQTLENSASINTQMTGRNAGRFVRMGVFSSTVVIALFAVLSFILKDFNLHVLAGYSLVALIGIFFTALGGWRIRFTKTKTAAALFASAATVLALLPNALISVSTLSIIFAIDIAMLYVIISEPGRQDVKYVFRVLLVASVMMSLYAVLVNLFPSIYYNLVKKILPSSAHTFIETGLSSKYGIAVGGEIITADYYAFFGMILSLNMLMLLGKKLKGKLIYIGIFALCALCIVLQNRKAELVMSVFVIAVLIFSNVNVISIHGKWKRIFIFALVSAIALTGFLVMLNQGYLARYELFFNQIVKNASDNSTVIDISSGRMRLWERAFNLFREHPVFGIGWGRFREHLTDTYNVLNEGQLSNAHNNYLQLLCETGVVGLILYTGPLFYFLHRTMKRIRLLRKSSADSLSRISASTSLSVQLFYLTLSFIDPVWYKMFTWPFFGVAIILLVYAEKDSGMIMEDETTDKAETIG